jgi:hypothetical protein
MGLQFSLVTVSLHLSSQRLLDNSLKVIITILHGSASGDKCLGKIDINLESLLDLRHLRSNEG